MCVASTQLLGEAGTVLALFVAGLYSFTPDGLGRLSDTVGQNYSSHCKSMHT